MMEPKSPKDTVYKVRNMRTEIPYIILSNPYPDCDDPPTSDRRQRVVPRGRPIPTCLIPFTLAYGVSGRALGEVIGPHHGACDAAAAQFHKLFVSSPLLLRERLRHNAFVRTLLLLLSPICWNPSLQLGRESCCSGHRRLLSSAMLMLW
jgi:hypothetical protein